MRGILLAVAMTVAFLPPALAGLAEEVAVTCPVCGNEFRAHRCIGANGLRGQDRDFLDHEISGSEPFLIGCWTCPRCRYTGLRPDFDPETAPLELVARLRKENPLRSAEPIDPKLGHSSKIRAWVRYDLMIQILKLRPETTPERLANTCLQAAQAQRFDWGGVERSGFGKRFGALMTRSSSSHRGNPYEADMATARAFESEAADPKSRLGTGERLDRRVAAAIPYKMRGEDPDALRVLASLGTGELPAEMQAVVEEIRVRIERERKYQLLAIPYFEKHLLEGGPDRVEHIDWACRGPAPGAIGCRYLLGVLYRRTGDPKKALAALEPLLEEEGIPEPIQPTSSSGFRDWIKDEIAKAKAG